MQGPWASHGERPGSTLSTAETPVVTAHVVTLHGGHEDVVVFPHISTVCSGAAWGPTGTVERCSGITLQQQW